MSPYFRFRAITSSYYRGAMGALLVYDITRRSTFESLRKWLKELREFGGREMVVVLVGNKSDLTHSREVNLEDGKTLAQLEDLSFMETSAKENLNVEDAFLQMLNRIYQLTSHKTLDAKLSDQKSNSVSVETLNGNKEIICIDEVSATKQTSKCCSYWTSSLLFDYYEYIHLCLCLIMVSYIAIYYVLFGFCL